MAESKPELLWEESRPAAESARQVLPKLAADFFRLGREIVASSPSVKDLHNLRLAVKRFRYTLELFRPCYGSGLEQRLEALKGIQDHLGAMNDCEVATSLVETTLPEADDAGAFLQFLKARGEQEQAGALRHWQEVFDAPGQEEWWVEYLTRPESLGSGRALEHSDQEPASSVLKTAAG
jgi:CHAD domain-containing protein